MTGNPNTNIKKSDFLNAIQLAEKHGKRAEDIHEIMLHEYKIGGKLKIGNTYRDKIIRDRTKHVSLDTMKRLQLHPLAEEWLLETLKAKGK